MRARLRSIWTGAWSSFWFIPLVMTTVAAAAAIGLVELDRRPFAGGGPFWWIYDSGWVYGGGVDGARALLQVVAGSMITVAGVVFSITTVALSLTSQQYGPRLLGKFMHDTGNQLVLGTFVSTFVYCLLVLRTVRADGKGEEFVPQIAVALAVLLALAGVAVLIYFIHHAADSIRVENLVSRVGRELVEEADRIFPAGSPHSPLEGERQPREDSELPGNFEESGFVVPAGGSGYVQEIDLEGLVKIAQERQAVLWLRQRRGSFVAMHAELARVYPEGKGGGDLAERVNECVILAPQRSGREDVDFLVVQLVEMASRALSPGINDPFTAVACLDQLGNGLAHLAGRGSASVYHYEDGALRLVTDEATFEGLVDLSFNQIRRYARAHPAVMVHMLEVIALVGANADPAARRNHLLEHARMIRVQAEEAVTHGHDRSEIEKRFESVARALESGVPENVGVSE